MIKIVAFSDTHTQHKQLSIPNGDVLVFAGDGEMMTLHKSKKFLKWFTELPHTYKILVAGNHDAYLQTNGADPLLKEFHFEKIISGKVPHRLEGNYYLEDGGVKITVDNRELKFYGSPWTRTFYDWAFMKPEIALREHWELIPNDTDILVTHSPPKYILDVNKKGESLGCPYLLQKVNFDMTLGHPLYHIFGHIHPPTAGQRRRHENDRFRNVSVLNEDYKLVYEPTILYI